MLECDPGLDDALAILLALGLPDIIDVKAIVATFGNVGLSQAKSNLLRILGFFRKSILLGSGSKGPIKGKAQEARHVHGEDGLGGFSQFFTKRYKGRFRDGIDLIIKLALSNKINKIIATGPLTDLARAIKRAPEILKNLDEIVIMGGAVFVEGNVTPYAEFNFHCDPEAAKIVLNADAAKRLVSLDVTHKTLLKAGDLKPLRGIKSPIARFICCIGDYAIYSNKKRGFSGAPMHDPLAAAIAIDPEVGRYELLCLDVETRGRKRGMVFAKKGKPNVIFCKKVDTKKFFNIFIGTLVKLSKECTVKLF